MLAGMDDPCCLKGKIAIVTGGAGDGIGHGITTVLARRGATVVIADINRSAADSLAERLSIGGMKVFARCVDVRHDQDVESLMAETEERFGALHILVNCAGIGMISRLEALSMAEYENVLDVNLKGMVRCCRHAVPLLRRSGGGAIINIASIHAENTCAGFTFYASSKAAVLALTRGLAIELGPDRIRVNAVLPGLVDCGQSRKVISQLTSQPPEQWIGSYVRREQAIPEATTPEQVGHMVAYLAGDAAVAVTGAQFVIDGGQLAMLTARDA